MADKEKKPFKINHHIIFAVLALVIIAIMIWRLNEWNHRTVVIDNDVEPGSFDMECQDIYVYPDPDAMAARKDDGVTKILVIGDSILTNNGKKNSILNELEKKLDAEIYPVTTDTGRLTAQLPEQFGPKDVKDAFSLYRISRFVALRDVGDLFSNLNAYPEELYVKNVKARANECTNSLAVLDMQECDIILIMYSFKDYYEGVTPLDVVEGNVSSYYGSVSRSIDMIQKAYPHINIIVASPYPTYLKDEKGNIELTSVKDLGQGNVSAYLNLLYYAATKYCVSYIDNYFYVINENNIEEYVTDDYLTDKGLELVSDHIASFITNKGNIE